MTNRFDGFPHECLVFFAALSANNNAAFFAEHRVEYEKYVAGPSKAFVSAMGDELRASISPGIRAEPKVGKSMFRINRDTRFSKDKTPYNTYADFIFWEGSDARTSPGLILRIARDYIVVGCGVFAFTPEMATRFRAAVADESSGLELEAAIHALRLLHPVVEISEPALKRVPAEYASDHPRGFFLRLKNLHATKKIDPPSVLHSPDFVAWCANEFRAFEKLHRWLVSQIGT